MGYQSRNVLITGGLGFIGSNLALRAAALGARVTVVDSSIEGCGANLHNLHPALDRIRLIPLDIAQAAEFAAEIGKADVIFNLAGEISHWHSMQFPERDLEINTFSQLRFLNVCREAAPGVRIIYAGTRQIYGVPQYLPVDEEHPIHPVDFNGVHKYAATMYHLMLTRAGYLDAAVLRLTNVYGPRMALHIPSQGFLSTYLRRIILGQPLEVFGDGAQLRDVVYVDDVVEAFLLAGDCPKLHSHTYNVGGPQPLPISEIATTCARTAGGVPVTFRPFPDELKRIDIGSYYTDWRRIRTELGWQPRIGLEEGLRRSVEYFRRELQHYLKVAPEIEAATHSGPPLSQSALPQ
ncbi:MAG: NAD-dependent epimerase/dehydratase family protein [Bryobacterales bacterium]|nr:NAD-dependent epimerase/dehydratase family protein [Bryobacterales bacterium]